MRCFWKILDLFYRDDVAEWNMSSRVRQASGLYEDRLITFKRKRKRKKERKLKPYGRISRPSRLSVTIHRAEWALSLSQR